MLSGAAETEADLLSAKKQKQVDNRSGPFGRRKLVHSDEENEEDEESDRDKYITKKKSGRSDERLCLFQRLFSHRGDHGKNPC